MSGMKKNENIDLMVGPRGEAKGVDEGDGDTIIITLTCNENLMKNSIQYAIRTQSMLLFSGVCWPRDRQLQSRGFATLSYIMAN
jgi:hypothetical protein